VFRGDDERRRGWGEERCVYLGVMMSVCDTIEAMRKGVCVFRGDDERRRG